VDSGKLVKESFLNNLTVVTGAPTAGKSLIAPIVSSFARTENFRMNILLEHLGTLNALGRIDDETLMFLWRYTVDFMAYDNFIGRDMNMRFGDETSIFLKESPACFLERLLADRGEYVLEQMSAEDRLIVVTLTDAFSHAHNWFAAFPFMKMIHIKRHPIDLVYSWYNHRYGEYQTESDKKETADVTFGSETYSSRLNQVLMLELNGRSVPHYARAIVGQYAEVSEMDRVILMIRSIQQSFESSDKMLSPEQKKMVAEITFDQVIHDSFSIVKELASFLGTEITSHTLDVLRREDCPREVEANKRQEKLEKIREEASLEGLQILQELVTEYEGENCNRKIIYS